MGKIEKRLLELGINLTEIPTQIANYLPAKRTGNMNRCCPTGFGLSGKQLKRES